MIDILMPRLSDTMTEGTVSVWHKAPGEHVSPGDVLVEIESDKAVMEQEAYDSGTLVEILVPAGALAAIGTPIARLDDGGPASTAPRAPVAEAAPSPSPSPPGPDVASARASAPASGAAGPRRPATPLVRRLARERGVDLDGLIGTGPGGRIVRADLDGAATGRSDTEGSGTAGSSAVWLTDTRATRMVPFDAIRQAVASRLTASGTTIPTFTVTASADVEALLALRGTVNAAAGIRVSVNDLLVRACALALREHPDVNASYTDEGRGGMLLHERVHIGVAVASDAGLVVPVVRDADRAAVSRIAETTRALVGRAADRRLTPEDMADGTFTISNLGMFGVEQFTALLNPPQGAILAVGSALPNVVLVDGAATSRRRMRLTLTADHRIIDGALAARFLQTLTALLEEPLRVIM